MKNIAVLFCRPLVKVAYFDPYNSQRVKPSGFGAVCPLDEFKSEVRYLERYTGCSKTYRTAFFTASYKNRKAKGYKGDYSHVKGICLECI